MIKCHPYYPGSEPDGHQPETVKFGQYRVRLDRTDDGNEGFTIRYFCEEFF